MSNLSAYEEICVEIFFEISGLSAEPNDGTNTLPGSFNFEDIFFQTAPAESSNRPA